MALSFQLGVFLVALFILFLSLPRQHSWQLLFALLLLIPSSAQGLISGTSYDTAGIMNISMVGYGVIIATIFLFVKQRSLSRRITVCVIACFAVILALRIIADGTEFISNKLFDNYFLPMLLALILISGFKVEWLPKLFKTVYCIILFGAVIACIEYLIGKSLLFHEYYMQTVPWYESIYRSAQYVSFRSCSLFGHPLIGSIYYLIGIVYLLNQKHLQKNKILFLTQMVILVLAVLSTNSRSAILGLALYLMYYLFENKRIGKLLMLSVMMVIVALAVDWEAVYYTFFSRDKNGTSFMIRVQALLSITRLPMRTLLLGEGFNNTKSVLQFLGFEGNVEISYLIILMENGILGFIAWAASIAFLYKNKMMKSAIDGFKAASAVKGMLLVILVVGGFSNSFGDPGTLNYMIYGLLAFSYILSQTIQTDICLNNQEYPLEAGLSKARIKGVKLTWKPPIWLDEDDGRATGIREENVSFGVFNTLIRRNVARPADLFRIMEQNNPNVPEHFAEKRMEAERAAFARLGTRMSLADIYGELLPLYGARTNDLMALEIQYEIAGCRPVAENIDLVNRCMEHDKNVFLMADTYLPSSVLRRMLDVCGVYHYDRLYVSCEEGARKADGSLFWKVLADQEIRPHELRHIGSDRQGDIVEPWRVGVHVKRGKKKDLPAVDRGLPEDIALYERTLQTCARNCADDLDSGDARLGCETFGPLLAGFTAWLREQLRRDNIQDVYFLAGDGSVLKQAFDTLEDGAFRTYSLYFPAQTAEQDHEALLAYLRACGMQGRVALVDTGRQIAVQKTLEQLIVEAGLNIQVKGYYVGLNADADGMQPAGYLYEPGKGAETLEKLSPITVLFDTVFHAQHGPVRRIAMRDGQPVPELDAYEYASDEGRICDEIAILRAYQAGAIELVQEMNTVFPGGVPQIPGEAALLPLLRMGTKPTLQEAELWGDFRVFRDGKATLMARPKGLGAYLLHSGRLKRDYAASPWKIGFRRRLSLLSLLCKK